MLSAGLDAMPFPTQARERVVVAIHDHCQVTGLWLRVVGQHQVNLGPSVLEPDRATGHAGRDGGRLEAQQSVKNNAILKV